MKKNITQRRGDAKMSVHIFCFYAHSERSGNNEIKISALVKNNIWVLGHAELFTYVYSEKRNSRFRIIGEILIKLGVQMIGHALHKKRTGEMPIFINTTID